MARFNRMAAMAVMLVACAPVLAQQNVEDRKAVLDAQIDLARKQAELNDALRRLAGGTTLGLPSVISISKVGGRPIARLQMPNGTSEYVREGEALRQGMNVTAITSKQVIISVANGKKQVAIPLDFVAVASATPQPNQSSVPSELLPTAPEVTLPVAAPPRVPATAPAASSPAPQAVVQPPAKVADAQPSAPKGR